MTGHSDRAHAEYAPSSADRWIGCTASVPFVEKLKEDRVIPWNKQNIFTLGGTGMHERSEEHLRDGTDPSEDFRPIEISGCEEAWDDGRETELIRVKLTADEWHPHVITYVENVRRVIADLELCYEPGDILTEIEKRVKIIGDDCWGSLDFTVCIVNHILYIIDLKTGKGKIVKPKDNEQFMLYAIGVCKEYNWAFKEIYLVAAQYPNQDDNFATHKTSVDELKEFEIKATAAIAESKTNPQFCTGSWCGWCDGIAQCPEQQKQVMAVFDDDVKMEVTALAPERLEFLLDNENRFKDFFKALHAYATEEAYKGRLPGRKMVAGKSNRKWIKDETAIVDTLEALDVSSDDMYDFKLKSFTKIEKIVGKVEFAALGLVEKPEGRPTLVAASDPRPPIIIGELFNDVDSLLM